MWKPFKCRLFREHDYQLLREPSALFLVCSRCGHRSRGWNLSDRRVNRSDNPLRLFMAEPVDAARAVCAPDGMGSEMWNGLTDAGELRLTLSQED
jgi:hypothetical protein